MSPLTQCWHKTVHEPGNNPRFNATVIAGLLNGALRVGGVASYSALLRDCLMNAPGLPVVPYALPGAAHLCPFGGPNGALLAAQLRRQNGQTIRIWSNDLTGPGARYQGGAALNAATECPRTNGYAYALAAGGADAIGADGFCGLQFPASVPAMAAWRGQCTVRIGFLDPDSYVAGGNANPDGQMDSPAHICWLTNLHQDASCTAGILFFSHQMEDERAALIAQFHNDAVEDYPHSVVFGHRNSMVGVKLRCHGEDPMQPIIARVRDSWAEWLAMVEANRNRRKRRLPNGLNWYVDGQA
jgi:hypothetical protein